MLPSPRAHTTFYLSFVVDMYLVSHSLSPQQSWTTHQVPLAVSILISSDFLQMQRLVAECLGFVGEHLTEIVKLPIDLSCLSDKMVLQLAKAREKRSAAASFVQWGVAVLAFSTLPCTMCVS